jgi:hypothetical protein
MASLNDAVSRITIRFEFPVIAIERLDGVSHFTIKAAEADRVA